MYAEVTSPSERRNVANSLNRNLAKIQSWCSTWGMKFNHRKTHLIIISRSRTPHPPLTLCGLDFEFSRQFKLLGVTLDDKITLKIISYYKIFYC